MIQPFPSLSRRACNYQSDQEVSIATWCKSTDTLIYLFLVWKCRSWGSSDQVIWSANHIWLWNQVAIVPQIFPHHILEPVPRWPILSASFGGCNCCQYIYRTRKSFFTCVSCSIISNVRIARQIGYIHLCSKPINSKNNKNQPRLTH